MDDEDRRRHPEVEPDIRPEAVGSASADELSRKEREAASGGSGSSDGSSTATGGEGGSTKENNGSNIDDVRDKEEAGAPFKDNTTAGGGDKKKKTLSGRIFGRIAKKGPIGAIIAALGIGGISFFGAPSLLPLQLKAVAENFYGNVSRSSYYHYETTLKYRIGNQKACAGKPGGIRCKMATSTDKTIKRFEDAGFKVDVTKVKGADGKERNIINSVTFPEPDGTKVTDGEAMVKHMNLSTSNKSSVFKIFNPWSGAYVGKTFTTKILQKLGLTRKKILIKEGDEKSVAGAFRREAGLPEDGKAAAEGTQSKVQEDLKTKGGKIAGKITNLLGVACGGYDLARGTLFLVKAANAAQYAAFAWFFLKLADQIRAGDVDPSTMAVAGAMLTKIARTGVNAGKSATDSPGYRAMAYGDGGALASTMQHILLGGNPTLIALDNSLIGIKEKLGTSSVHRTCKASNNVIIGAALTAIMCGAGGGAAGTVVPILGNVVGGVGGVIACTAANIAIGAISGLVIGKIIDLIMPSVIAFLKENPPSFDLPGVDIGNVFTIGSSLIYGSAGLVSGMKLGTESEVNDFTQLANESDRQQEAVARYDARETPFDITNQYSFMGQFVNRTGIANGGSNPITAALSSIGSILSGASSSLLSTTAFADDLPSTIKKGTLHKCKDPELADQNLVCDIMDQPQTVQSLAEMTQPEEENLDYMISNNYVSEEGTVNDGNDYAKYIKYCTHEEGGALGTSGLSIADDDYVWIDGKCNESSQMLSNFRTYTSRTIFADNEDTQYDEKGNAGTGTTDTSTTPTPGSDLAVDDYASECGKYAYCTGQCVDFVLFRLVKHGVLPGKRALGNGGDVVGTLGSLGYTVNTTPAVHSVMSTFATSHPDLGHTAMVSQVNADGSIIVEEYNYANPLHYGTRLISAQEIKDKNMTFAHTEVDYQ